MRLPARQTHFCTHFSGDSGSRPAPDLIIRLLLGHPDRGDCMLNSIWANTVELPAFPSLDGDLDTDVLIIGGGMAGLLCAQALDE